MESEAVPNRAEAPTVKGMSQSTFNKSEVASLARRFDLALEWLNVPYDASRRQFRCPACARPEPKKTKIFDDGGLKCHKCGFGAADAFGALYKVGGYSFGEAKAILMGRDPKTGGRTVDLEKLRTVPELDPEPETVVDSEVLAATKAHGNLRAGQLFWGRFHISPDIVRWFGSVRITKPYRELVKALVSDFGEDRLVAAGIAKQTERGLWTIFGPPRGGHNLPPEYPVLQFYLNPETGQPVGLEVRGSERVESRVRAHEEWKKREQAWEASGRQGPGPGKKVDWVRKTTNLIGNAPGSRPGFGLWHVAQLSGERVVWLVEGHKDCLAAWSMGQPAIGLAGVSAEISDDLISSLRGHRAKIAFDADEAGEAGAVHLRETLLRHEITVIEKPLVLPPGKDITDLLVARHQESCDCKPELRAALEAERSAAA